MTLQRKVFLLAAIGLTTWWVLTYLTIGYLGDRLETVLLEKATAIIEQIEEAMPR